MKSFILYFLLLLKLDISVYGQEYSYSQFTEKDGLPSDYIYGICQDKEGFIWLATENGVCRFDGKHFKTFTTKDGLPDNAILGVVCTWDGRVWAMPFMNVPYYYNNGRFVPVNVAEADRKKLLNVYGILSLGDKILFNLSNGQYLLGMDGILKKPEEVFTMLPAGASISRLNDSVIVTGWADSIFLVEGNQCRFICMNISESSNRFLTNINKDYSPVFAEYRGPGKAFSRGITNNSLFYLNEKDNLHFFGGYNGDYKYSIKSRKPSNALVDNENTIWVTTLGYGLFHYPSLAFTHTRFSNDHPELFSIEKINNGIVAGDNLSRIFEVKSKKTYKDFTAPLLAFSGNTPAQASRMNRVYKLMTWNGNLYAGADGLLIKMDRSGKETVKSIYPVKDLSIDNDNMLVCLGTGALLLNPDNLSIKDTLLTQRTTAGVISGQICYIGTLGGLIKMNTVTREITHLSRLDNSLAGRITAVKKREDGSLWISTSGSGIVRLEHDKVTKHITTAEGLSSDICTTLFMDGDDIWAGTNKGLNKISLIQDSVRITQYSTVDGLSSNIVNAIYADSAVVYVASPAGLNSFSKSFEKEKSECLLRFLQVTAGDSVLTLDSVYHFPYYIKNIRIDYVGISYKSAGDIKYYYQVEGIDNKWNMTTNGFVSFPVLQPGDYTFKLKAVNKFGVESVTRKIVIIISLPWWKKWWFISLIALAGSLIIYRVYRRRIHLVRKDEANKRELQTQFAALEQQALQAQMNPHFIFNCLNSVQSFIIRHDVEGANRYLTKFASLIRQTLDNSSRDLIPLKTEIKYLETYLSLEQARKDEKFNYEISTDLVPDIENFMIPAMLLQPYVENAIRHGVQHRDDDKGLIEVRFEKDAADRLVCTIKDNGVGRQKSAELKSAQHIEYMSRGNSITEKRIEMLSLQYNAEITLSVTDLEDPGGLPAGTMVKLVFPRFGNTKYII